MTTPITTSINDSQMHNNIMAAGLRDRPPMLAMGRYAQWQSRFLRYIDTRPNGDALRKCILQGPYTPSTVTIPAVPATYDTPTVPERTTIKIILNMSPENNAHYESEKEVIHLLLTRIRDEIYSTVDACKTTHEIWIAIERLQQGESLNIQYVKTNLFWEFGKFTSHDGESMESYYSRFYKMMNQMIRNNLTVATMQVNYQKEVNEIRAERIAKNANPLALVATASPYPDPYYQAPKSHKPYVPTSKQSSFTRSIASTKFKGKEIAKPITPPSESASEEGSQVVQQSRIQCFNCKEFGHFSKECKKPKRVKDSTYQKEKMLSYKQAEKGVPLQAEQSDWLAYTDEEIDEQELEAHYNYMAKIQEVPTTDSATDERVALANLIANLKLDVDEYKKIQKQLKKSNTSLSHELKECKSILMETSRTLGESNSIRDSCLIALQNKQTDLETYKTLNDRTLDYDKFEHKELVDQAWEKHSHDHFRAPTAHDMEILIKTCLMPLALKTQNDSFTFVHEIKKSTCFVRDLQGNDLLTGNRGSDLYTISLQETISSTPICFMARALATQAWLWHRRLSHLNFDYINLLSKKDVVIGLPKLKYVKDQLCSSCEVASIIGKKYILVIVDDYSRYTWTLFLRSKDETPEVLKDFLTMIQGNLQALMKEKGDSCILVKYSTQSKGYRVYNKRTRLIVESIHLRFDEIKEMSETSIDNDTSGLVLQ
ncbi:retrovirus-related pol polyprotein from transposon TNT 1-94 [Tanacetum coccineum]